MPRDVKLGDATDAFRDEGARACAHPQRPDD